MSLHGAIQVRLAAQVSGVSGRIYRQTLPQNPTLPACVYFVVSNNRLHDLDGPEGLAEARVQVTTWADKHSTALTNANAVRVALDGWTGTADSTVVVQSLIDNELDGYDPELMYSGITQDFMVTYEE